MIYQTLTQTIDNSISIITINRPDKLNALNDDVINELSLAIDEVIYNSNIKSAIITGSGTKAFVAGADITEFIGLTNEEGTELAQRGRLLVFEKIEYCTKPIVAAVNGFALGGGCELAMACHFRTASENAKFGQPEVNLGLIPGYGGTQRLVRLIGKGKAMELILTGNMIDALEAKSLGLVNHVYSPENLLDETLKILNTINTKSPNAIAKAIQAVNVNYSKNGFNKEIQYFGECFNTPEMIEGVTAFIEKRKPNF